MIAALLGSWHLVWALFVLIGWVKCCSISFLGSDDQADHVVKPFDPIPAVVLIMITTVIGYVFGFLGAMSGTDCRVFNHSAKNGSPFANNAESDRCLKFMFSS